MDITAFAAIAEPKVPDCGIWHDCFNVTDPKYRYHGGEHLYKSKFYLGSGAISITLA